MSIASEIQQITASLPEGVRLVAVSKYHPAEAIREAYAAGQRIFGESKVQEMTQKHEELPQDIQWHFIGHLQTNKIKYLAPYVTLIHGIDSLKLLTEVDKQAAKVGRIIPCLLQIHLAQEETKFGFTFEECRAMLASDEFAHLTHVRIDGVMGMASNVDDEAQIRAEFHSLRAFFDELRTTRFAGQDHFREVSMGMSHDYPIALSEGATLVRIGSKIFGERDYGTHI